MIALRPDQITGVWPMLPSVRIQLVLFGCPVMALRLCRNRFG